MRRTARAFCVATCAAAVLLATPPAPADDVGVPVIYALDEDSSFQEGCFEGCACPISIASLSGTFTLTPITLLGTWEQYAVTDVDWTIGLPGSGGSLSVTGSGTYTIFQEFAVQQRMELDLVIEGQPEQHFDSDMIVIMPVWPDIDVTVSKNQLYCFDTAFFISAAPQTACPADLDGDGVVGFADVLALLTQWGACTCPADLDQDGSAGFQDLLMMLGAWGGCP